MSASENNGLCRVFDMNANLEVREHDVGGALYRLSSHGDGTLVPLAHALMFLRDPAFVVMDDHGNRMKMQGPAEERPDIKLSPHQTIANLNELSVAALAVRAVRLPGSRGLTKNSGKKKLIGFIMAGGIKDEVETNPLDPDTESLIEDDPEDPDGDGDGDTGVADQALEGEPLPVI